MSSKFIKSISTLPLNFWILNIISMLEKLAYWTVLLQLPIYIAQKGESGGLEWEQSTKGIIFFFWAVVQNITPVFAGTFADKLGRKKLLLISFIIIVVSYVLIGTQREFYPFLFSVVLLGLGLGIYKPSLQGAIATHLNKENSSTGWGVYFMLLNAAVFAGPPLSKYLKELSWEMVFFGSAIVFSLNFFVLLFVKSKHEQQPKISPSIKQIVRIAVRDLSNARLLYFICLIAGFMIIYMQFYETLPNFIYDWSDTSQLGAWLSLPDSLLMVIGGKQMISYEWLYNLNAGIVVLFVVFVSWIFARINKIWAIIIGIAIAMLGLSMTGWGIDGKYLVLGMMIYSFGEIIVNPKYNEYISSIAPLDGKSQYLGYVNLSFAIGLGGGSLLGGYLYGKFGEKASLALDYIKTNYPDAVGINKHDAFAKLMELKDMTSAELTEYLWNLNHPGFVWYPFMAIGIISIIGLIFYKRKYD
jgi:proton-dependent oligopeptide transporter, POT family